MPVLSLACHLPHNTPNIPSRYNNEQTTKQTKAINNSYIYISHVNVTQTVPDISPLMPMHQDPLLVWDVMTMWIMPNCINILRQNGRHIADDIFNSFSWMEMYEFRLRITLKCIPKYPTNNNPALAQIMALRRPVKELNAFVSITSPLSICTRPWLYDVDGSQWCHSTPRELG